MWKVVPWAAVGFFVGSLAGFSWGKKAKSNIGQAVSTDFSGGKLTVEVDTITAARSGLADPVNELIDGWF